MTARDGLKCGDVAWHEDCGGLSCGDVAWSDAEL